VQRPSLGLLLTTLAAVVPAVWFLWPQPDTSPTSTTDAAVFCAVFLGPQVTALVLSAFRGRVASALTVAVAVLGLVVALLAVPLYLLGALFLGQAAAATAIAAHRHRLRPTQTGPDGPPAS
jgi:hypothetical protein